MVKSFAPKSISEPGHLEAFEAPSKKAPLMQGGRPHMLEHVEHDEFEAAPRAQTIAEVPKVPFEDVEKLKAQLQPGDIFLSYYPKSSDAVAFAIRTGQKAASQFGSQKAAEKSYNFVHAGMYVGGGKVSEAVGEGVVANELDGPRFKLKPEDKHSFLVIRPKNKAMADEASKIATSLSKAGESKPLKYSMKHAFLSGLTLGEDKLNEKGLRRYLKGAAYAHAYESGETPPPLSKNGVRDFFCSHFVGFACQAGESKDVVKRINQGLAPEEQIAFPDFSQIPEKQQAIYLDDWAKDTARQHRDALNDHIDVDFDPKMTSPQRFYDYVMRHPELFETKMAIVAPKK